MKFLPGLRYNYVKNSDKQAAEIEHPDKLIQQLKNIQFDADSFEIKNSQETIRLAKKECLILQTLLRHPKKIFYERRTLWISLGGYIFTGRQYSQHSLSNLRKKLSQLDPEQEYIETIWGVGVRIKRRWAMIYILLSLLLLVHYPIDV